MWVFSPVAVLGFSCPTTCRILVPQVGIEPESATVEGRFLATGPPGRSSQEPFKIQVSRSPDPEIEVQQGPDGNLRICPICKRHHDSNPGGLGGPRLEKHCHGWISMKGFGCQDQWEKVFTLSPFASRPPCEEERSGGKSILSVRGRKPSQAQ